MTDEQLAEAIEALADVVKEMEEEDLVSRHVATSSASAPARGADPTLDAAPREHKWTGVQRGGDPAEAGSYEWVRYCQVCGMEDTCEDPLPPCFGSKGGAL